MAKKSKSNAGKKEETEKLKALTEEERKQAVIEKFGLENAELYMKQEEIVERERAIDLKEKELAKKNEEINNRKARILTLEEDSNKKIKGIKQDISEKEKQLKALNSDIETRTKAIEKIESETASKERSLIERENNAENGFALQNKKALESLSKRRQELKDEIQSLETEEVDKKRKIAEEIAELRAEKIKLANTEINDYYNSRKSEIDNELLIEQKIIADKKINLDLSIEEYQGKICDLEEQERDLSLRKRQFEIEKRNNERYVNQKVADEVDKFRDKMEYLAETAEHYKKSAEENSKKLLRYEQLERDADGNSIEKLLNIIRGLKEENSKLKKENGELPSQYELLNYKSKADTYDRTQSELYETKKELLDLQNERHNWLMSTTQLAIARENYEIEKKMREVMEASINKYAEEVNRFKSLYEQPKELTARLDAIKKPVLEKRQLAEDNISEVDWLNRIYKNCLDSDIHFNKRLLYSFHTALKTSDWSPLTVLAGVSGTGKSILPEYYAVYGGLYFMSMAVQPDWDSPQALFGYFNSVDNRFNATTLLRAMVQFSTNSEERSKDSNLSDTMFLVLLDEMNLAHVELYFSDMLSKLERRRNTNDEVYVEIDLGAGMDKYKLELNNNVLWTGTMNEDETTKALSDKVIDRGNIISFPRPKEFMSRKRIHNNDPAPMLSKSTWNSWLEDNVIEDNNFTELIKKYKKGLEEVNEAMGNVGRALGHRVWQSIENYMANHPMVIQAFKESEFNKDTCDKALQGAFEEALVHKVMPKLRGIETDGNMKTQIDRIRNVLFGNKGIANGLLSDFNSAVNNTYETFLWNSAQYLEDEE